MKVTLRSIGATYGGLAGKSGKDFGRGSGRYITFTEVMAAPKLVGRSLERVDVGAAERQNEVRRGDVLFNGSSETPEEVALSAVVDFDVPRGVYLNSFCFGFRLTRPDLADPTYLAYLFRSGVGREVVFGLAQGATRYNIAKTKLLDAPLDLPALAEQKAVAEALTRIDELIAQISELITKKRAIKQGMMQELLTGRTRLPGFARSWSIRKIGDFTEVKAGGTPPTSVPRYWGGAIRWMSSGEIHQKRVHEVIGRITVDGLRESSAQMLPVGTVLMALAGQGKTRGTVAVSRVELSTNQSIAGIFPSAEHDSDFLYYNLDTRYEELRGESAGDGGRGGLNLAIIKRLAILMPDLAEQQAIARVLSDADDEIEALGRRLEATRAIKQGMMQELLTGRTRLVRMEESA